MGVSGVALVCLAAAVGVGAGALGLAHNQFRTACLTGLEHGNLHGFACSVELSGDVEQVLSGGGHWGCSLWYEAKIG